MNLQLFTDIFLLCICSAIVLSFACIHGRVLECVVMHSHEFNIAREADWIGSLRDCITTSSSIQHIRKYSLL